MALAHPTCITHRPNLQDLGDNGARQTADPAEWHWELQVQAVLSGHHYTPHELQAQQLHSPDICAHPGCQARDFGWMFKKIDTHRNAANEDLMSYQPRHHCYVLRLTCTDERE